jgi:hypothetical protein
MLISRRSLARAGALTLAAATFAACSDSSTQPLDLNPDQLQSIGESIATELEGGVTQLTASDVMAVGMPTLSKRSMVSGLKLARSAQTMQQVPEPSPDCGVPSQNPPTDTDADNVPDNFSITFALPACHFSDIDGAVDMTGVMHISDPNPGSAGMALNFSLDNLRFAFSGTDGSGSFVRDGSASVAVTETGLSQLQDWSESAQISGLPRLGVNLNWTATFAALAGSTITPGQPLPSGVYSPNGSVEYREGNRVSSFSVETVAPLQYDAACAAGVADGTSLTPFTAGEVHITVNNAQGSTFVKVTYADCNYATVQLANQ